MSATIDHLRIDHRVTVLRDFTDAAGLTLRSGESGILCGMSFDQLGREIHLEIERAQGKVALRFLLNANSGPRNGHMREYFELGEDVSMPRDIPAFHNQAKREMIVPPPENAPGPRNDSAWDRAANSTDGPDHLKDVEEEMRMAFPHIGAAASIAEIYAKRMCAFQRAGNEPRAVAAFKLAVDWMWTYASWATSGGEGAALSYDRERFHAALAGELGYDPTEDPANRNER